MANDGYMGKILKVDLTDKKISVIDTEKYKSWGGGHGMGTAIFWDECEDVTVDGFDPKNVITIMASPLSGTIAPSASGRTEVQMIGTQGYPINWYTRSNFGGRFSGMLKYAGWDGIVIKGKADEPCWLDIRNGNVKIQSAEGIWGLNTDETQQEIWRRVRSEAGRQFGHGWYTLEKGRDTGNTTQNPSVLTIGPIGEQLSPLASLVHESGNGAGQGGFGAVFGSKNLKAISVIGTGEVVPADMKALMDTRLWAQQFGSMSHLDKPIPADAAMMTFAGPAGGGGMVPALQESVASGCMACHKCCRRRNRTGRSNGSSCVDFAWFMGSDMETHGQMTQELLDSTDLMQRHGINAYALYAILPWLRALNKQGILGPGKEIDTDLDFSLWGTAKFVMILFDKIEHQKDIGKYLHMGVAQGANALGRWDKDTTTGILDVPYWGYANHYDPRTEFEWGYGTLVGDRDINEHDFNSNVYWIPTQAILSGKEPPYTAEAFAEVVGKVCAPFNDPKMVDYSDEGLYSDSSVSMVAWHRHYTRFFKQSLLFCDWSYSNIWNPYAPDNVGMTGMGAETRIYNAVTGNKLTFEEGMEMGRKIWNFDRSIWCLQGRDVKNEVFSKYIYEVNTTPGPAGPYIMPAYIDGKWQFANVSDRHLDFDKVEEWKQKFYAEEGWDTNGVPTRKTLEDLGLKKAADALEKAGKLS